MGFGIPDGKRGERKAARYVRGRSHPGSDALVLAALAVLAGALSWRRQRHGALALWFGPWAPFLVLAAVRLSARGTFLRRG